MEQLYPRHNNLFAGFPFTRHQAESLFRPEDRPESCFKSRLEISVSKMRLGMSFETWPAVAETPSVQNSRNGPSCRIRQISRRVPLLDRLPPRLPGTCAAANDGNGSARSCAS